MKSDMKKKLTALLIAAMTLSAPVMNAAEMRRPISNEMPMWLIHLDTWNYPDPERIIELIPKDILPFCVFNISLSASDNVCCSGPNVCDSWLKACAAKNVWCTVQCASGGHSRFSDFDLTYYERYYNEYPNFIGWNFAEQFWGFGEDGTPTFPERLALFGELLKLGEKYGGYLIVSFTQAEYSADMMPIAYMKRNRNVCEQLTSHPENFICCEKYTMPRGFFEIESNCLGAWLGGYAGQYGIRFDECGWATSDTDADPFVTASGAIPIMEHMMLTGETVTDGPELIWQQDTRETGRIGTSDGYSRRAWDFYPQFVNINIDEFRKFIDGTVRILTRSEVIDRTKICVVNDLNNGNKEDDYTTPKTMFHGLYRQDYDGNENDPIASNKWWMKKTGRYPTFPQVYGLLDDDAKRLIAVKKSEYSKRWPDTASKVAEFNSLFPQVSTGDIYAAHAENTWMTYNPYQYEYSGSTVRTSTKRAKGNVPFLYNTASSISFDYAPYSMGVMKEFPDSLLLYLSNYRTSGGSEYSRQTDTIWIYGAEEEPAVSWNDRGKHSASTVTSTYENGVLKLAVKHNGPLEIGLKIQGNEKGRLTQWTPANIRIPAAPPVYTGVRQYEGEFFDYKNGAGLTTNGYNSSYSNYYGQGYMTMGSNSNAMARDTIWTDHEGEYNVALRYRSPQSTNLYLSVNGERKLLSIKSSFSSSWNTAGADFSLKKGANVVVISYSGSAVNTAIDCIQVTDLAAAVTPWVSLSASSLAAPAVQSGAASTAKSTLTVTSAGISDSIRAYADNGAFIVKVRKPKAQTAYVDISLDSSMPVADYSGTLTVVADDIVRRIPISGSVTPGKYTYVYDFESDAARTSASITIAKGIGKGSKCPVTGGVVSYTDNSGRTSNMVRIYTCDNTRNGSGVLNLTKFTSQATDYSVTWRQVLIGSGDYKNGVLLRGDNTMVGNSSDKGYTQGIFAGYYLSVYNHGTATDVRIYKSTASTSLNMMTQKGIDLSVSTGQSVWYRASVSGTTKVSLKLEYSTDGKNWKTATSTTDESNPFQIGATQYVWGLAASRADFLIDDITFEGTTYDETVLSVREPEYARRSTGLVYDMFGRSVGTESDLDMLPAGIYILDGRKIVR